MGCLKLYKIKTTDAPSVYQLNSGIFLCNDVRFEVITVLRKHSNFLRDRINKITTGSSLRLVTDMRRDYRN